MKEVKTPKKPLLFYYAVALLVLFLFNLLAMPWLAEHQIKDVDYNTFVSMTEKKEIGQVEIQQQDNRILFTSTDGKTIYKTAMVPDDGLVQRLLDAGISTTGEEIQQTSLLMSILGWVLPLVIFIAVGQIISRNLMKKMGGGSNSLMFGMGKSNAKVYVQSTEGIKFADVAGEDEAKENLQEIVNYLHDPGQYQTIGAHMPKGVLLVGPPGTGKTLLAKAVAGEAGVKFLSISGSDFVEMYVGVGASRVRDLFVQAKKDAPAIVFIDEIDAVGRQRGSGLGGGHDEREQTLNQLLVEMDGFGSNEGVVVLAATNRVDILDPALLRPGRFDRQVYVGLPDIKGREEILKIHARNKPLAEDVDLGRVAKGTPGFTGADLENLLNEAALLTGRQDKVAIDKACIDEAVIKVIAGPEKHSRVIPPQERKLTAYHEAGHAVVMRALPQHDPVHQITIVPRGQAGGMTISLPDEDRSYLSREYMLQQIVSLLGGRAAEQLMLGDISTGASNDIQRATSLARRMVGTYGMSEKLGTVAFDAGSDEVFIGKSMGHTRPYSEKTAAEMDGEIRAIIDEAYQKAQDILRTYQKQLTEIAEYLLANETMNGDVFESFFTEVSQDAQ